MGIKEREFGSLPTNLSLEEVVPKDNLYRRLEERLDLSFVRELVADCYAALGRASIDPAVSFRLQLVMFFEDIRSERRLMELAADRLSIRWYLGYDLHEPLPDHSSLTRIRERYGIEVFRRFFERIVEECFGAGLVWGEELYFDSTEVRANADVDSLRSRSMAENHLEELFEETDGSEEIEDFVTPHLSPDAPATDALPTAGNKALKENNAQKAKDWVSRDDRQDRAFISGPRKRTAGRLMSATDPDATPMRVSGNEAKLGYQAHYVVDGGKARVILNVLVTSSEVTENRPMLDLLWNSVFRWRFRPRQVTGDAKYGTRQNVAAIEKAGIRAYVANPNFDFRDTGRFGPGHFRYDTQGNHHVRPAGQILRFQNKDHRNRRKRYRAKPSICNACELKARCTTSERGRMLY